VDLVSQIKIIMKKLLPLFIFTLITTIVAAQVSKTVNVTTAGTLTTLLTTTEKSTVTNLTITGTIDARDFVTMSNFMLQIDTLDISNVTIAAYTGTVGQEGQNSRTYPANELPSYAFMNTMVTNGGSLPLKNIVLPTSLTSIASGAFGVCISLINIAIPNSVTNIATDAFSYCIGLKEIIVQADNPNFSVKDGVLFNKNQTVLLRYPAGKTGDYSIPASVSNIGNSSFSDSKNLTAILIGNSVTAIGTSAFSGCTGLTNVVIPTSVTSLGASSFYCCFGLTSVSIPNTIASIDDGTFYYCKNLVNLSIPNYVISLGILSFYACESLTSVIIPNSVTTIKQQAFNSCSNLASVTLGSSVSSLDSLAFKTCNKMVEFNVQADNPLFSATDGVLFNKNKTVLVQFPKGKQGAYSIPSTVTSIEKSAFSKCKGLTGITIPNSVITIGNHAFEYCSALANLTIGNYVTSIGDYAFSGCFLSSLTIPNSVTSIGSNCFESCTHVTSLSIGNSVKKIGDNAFSECSMTNLIIPNSVTSIGNYAFSLCMNLTTITFGNSLSTIGDFAFRNCSGLTNITIPSSLTAIGNSVFSYCHNLANINVQAGNSYFSSDGGVLLNIDKTTLLQCPAAKQGICIIPATVKSIAENAFVQCNKLTNIIIPTSVTSIGYSAFSECRSLTTISIPKDITSIGAFAFRYCTALTSIYAYPVNPVDLTSALDVFLMLNNPTLYVPMGSKSLYQAASQWKDFSNIVEMPSAVPTLSDTKIKIHVSGLSLIIEGTTKGETVSLYTLNGKQIQTIKSTSERLNLPFDRDRVYLVKIGENTFKVIL